MCLLCGEKTREGLGPILTSINCHYLCIKFSSGILDNSSPPNEHVVSREVRRALKLRCVFCKKFGAFVGCNIKQCPLTYHLHCGDENGVLKQYHTFSTYCHAHRPKNHLPKPGHPTPPCDLCSSLITDNKDLVFCPACNSSFHLRCCQERADQGQTSCARCGDTEKYIEELSFFGIWFRNKETEKSFLREASGPPSYTISYLSREVARKDTMERETMSPISVLSRQASPTPELSPIKDILEFVTDSTPREEDSGTSRDCSRERDSSPFYRRKISKLPGRSPKKRVVRQISSDSRKSRTRSQDTSASHSGEDLKTSTEMISGSEMEGSRSQTSKCSGSETLQPDRKKVKLTYTDTSDGPLSDIDDILKGNISDPETHPMRDAIFHPENKHLDEVMRRMSEKENDDIDDKENMTVQKPKNKRTKQKDDSKIKKSKKKIPAKKTSPRKALLLKKTSKKFADNERSQEDEIRKTKKKKVTARVKMLPLTERQIFHGRNWTPMSELKEEESECNSDWVLKFGELRLADIADVNPGEKRLLNKWNIHMNRYMVPGIKHMNQIVMEFIDDQKETIIQENLYRNLVSHLSSLLEVGIITQEIFLSAIAAIQNHISDVGIHGLDKSWSSHFKGEEKVPVVAHCSTPVRSYGRNVFSSSSPSPSASTSISKASPLSRGMKLVNLSLNSQKAQDKKRLSAGSLLPPFSPRTPDCEEERTKQEVKRPRLSDASSNSSPGSLLLQISDSSFSSHSSGIVKDVSTLVEDKTIDIDKD